MTENDGNEEVYPSSSSSEAPTPTPRSLAQGVFDTVTSFFCGDPNQDPNNTQVAEESPNTDQEPTIPLRVDTSPSLLDLSSNSNEEEI